MKIKEFKGDKLASFLAVLIFNEPTEVTRVCSNHVFGITGMKLGLTPLYSAIIYANEKTDPRTKAFANAYEVRLWEVYIEHGLEEALEFFKETAVETYMETKEGAKAV